MKILREVGRALPILLLVALLAFSVFRGCGRAPQGEWNRLPFTIHYAPTATDADHNAETLNDGDTATYYAVSAQGSQAPGASASNVLILDLGQSAHSFSVSRIDYTPRQDDGAEGRILKYNIYFLRANRTGNGKQYVGDQLSLDVDFELAGRGQFDPGSKKTQSAILHPYTGQLLAIQAVPSSTNGGSISAAEIAVYAIGGGAGVPDDDYGAHKAEIMAIRQLAQAKNLPALLEIAGEIDAQVGTDSVEFNKNSKAEQQRLLKELKQLRQAAENAGALPSLPNGGLWVDTSGKPIQAHSGSFFYVAAEKKYYWYGVDASQPNLLGTDHYQAVGVRCYSSTDLRNWASEGLVLPVFNNPQLVDGSADSDKAPLYVDENSKAYQNSPLRTFRDNGGVGTSLPPNGMAKPASPTLAAACGSEGIAKFNALYASYGFQQRRQLYLSFNWEKELSRPQVTYNPQTKQYIMWLLVEDYAPRQAGENEKRTALISAMSQSPAGPFLYVGGASLRLQAKQSYAPTDFSLFTDADGSAWLAATLQPSNAEKESGLYLLRLNNTWLEPAAKPNGISEEGEQWMLIPNSEGKAAPILFRAKDVLYLIANEGGQPSESVYYVSKNGILGDWKAKGAFALEDSAKNTYRSVGSAVIPLRNTKGEPVAGKYYLLADLPDPYDARHARYALLPLHLGESGNKLALRWESNALPKDFGNAPLSLAIVLICAGALLAVLALVFVALLIFKRRDTEETDSELDDEYEAESFAVGREDEAEEETQDDE